MIFDTLKLLGGKFLNNKITDKAPNITSIYDNTLNRLPKWLQVLLIISGVIVFSLHYFPAETLMLIDFIAPIYNEVNAFADKHKILFNTIYFIIILYVATKLFCNVLNKTGGNLLSQFYHKLFIKDLEQDKRLNVIEDTLHENSLQRDRMEKKLDKIIDKIIDKNI
ncbi:MAG: hypothetical protein Ta2D_11780 [Rickettsiales bacterium]|nr:MAG: hypothetical protein Ta2D_11780 [Rickettsiales bacterium]